MRTVAPFYTVGEYLEYIFFLIPSKSNIHNYFKNLFTIFFHKKQIPNFLVFWPITTSLVKGGLISESFSPWLNLQKWVPNHDHEHYPPPGLWFGTLFWDLSQRGKLYKITPPLTRLVLIGWKTKKFGICFFVKKYIEQLSVFYLFF